MVMRRAMIAGLMVMCGLPGAALGEVPAAGYILTEHFILWGNRIWGIGETLDDARDDARKQGANLDHDGEEMDDWIAGLTTRRATAELMQAARRDRWTTFRRLPGGVWGTPAEYQASPAARGRESERVVLPRDLMTREERAAFRARMQQASPEERDALWHQQLAVLQQRAAARGMGLTVLAMRPDGTFHADELPATGLSRPGGGGRAP
jgi:hypothetical protein